MRQCRLREFKLVRSRNFFIDGGGRFLGTREPLLLKRGGDYDYERANQNGQEISREEIDTFRREEFISRI